MVLQRLALGSIGISLLVLSLKVVAWRLTGSVALYSDALESIVNVASAVVAWGAVKLAAKPADQNHPYGHHKVEYFAAVAEGVLIVLAALAIGAEAYKAFFTPRMPDLGVTGVGVSLLATLVNGAWCMVLMREGKALRSPALVADGRHLLTDVVSSGSMLVGLGLMAVTGWIVLDAVMGMLVAVNIVWSGLRLLRESLGGLMDEALPEADVAKLTKALAAQAKGAMEIHDLRTRAAGGQIFVEFHLVVPGSWTVRKSHELCDALENTVRKVLGGAVHSTIHVEPEEKAKRGQGKLPAVAGLTAD